jgi:hypothetical protein
MLSEKGPQNLVASSQKVVWLTLIKSKNKTDTAFRRKVKFMKTMMK